MAHPWAGSVVPVMLIDHLRSVPDGRDQLAVIAMHHFRDLVRQVAWQVGDAKAEDIVQDVILRHLGKHDTGPQSEYTSVNAYHKLRSSLITSTKNAAIDHLRRKSTRAEIAVGSFSDDTLHDLVGRKGGDPAFESPDDAPRDVDGAALHDGLRRIDKRHSRLLRMKLSGATFSDIATHMGVSTTTAYNAYQRAMRAVQPLLERYVAGGFCDEYGPHLLLARQEHDCAGNPPDEQPLTDMIGTERAREIRLHVYGDPDVPADDGCVACRHSGAEHGAALIVYLPTPLLLVPAGGLFAVAKSTAAGTWGSITGCIGALLGDGGTATGGAGAGAMVAAKGAAVVAAAALAVGGTITVRHLAGGYPSTTTPATTLAANPIQMVAARPRRVTPPSAAVRTSAPRTATSSRANTAGSGSPAAEFTPAPEPRSGTPPTSNGGSGGAAGEFTP